jgi:hypothetical protein
MAEPHRGSSISGHATLTLIQDGRQGVGQGRLSDDPLDLLLTWEGGQRAFGFCGDRRAS